MTIWDSACSIKDFSISCQILWFFNFVVSYGYFRFSLCWLFIFV